jgi:hypothetical protein
MNSSAPQTSAQLRAAALLQEFRHERTDNEDYFARIRVFDAITRVLRACKNCSVLWGSDAFRPVEIEIAKYLLALDYTISREIEELEENIYLRNGDRPLRNTRSSNEGSLNQEMCDEFFDAHDGRVLAQLEDKKELLRRMHDIQDEFYDPEPK